MKKTELVKIAAKKAGKSQKATCIILESILETIQETLARGEKVQFYGFGCWTPYIRSARKVVEPCYGKTIQIPEKNSVRFRVGAFIKDALLDKEDNGDTTKENAEDEI